MKPRRSLHLLTASFAFALVLSMPASYAATATKAATGTDLTDPASWSGGSGPGFPTSADTATWASTSLGSGLTLGSAGSWGGISVASALSNIDISGAGTLTLAGSGINLSASTVNLSVANPITLSAGNTWTVNTGKTLTLSGNVAGNQDLTIAGGGTSTLSGSGANSFGRLAVGTTGSSATTSTLSLTSGTTSFSNRPCIGSTAAARGLVNVSGTATVNFGGDLLMFAGSGNTNLRATAVLAQSGGTVNVTSSSGTLMPWAGSSGVAYGAYLLSSGTLNATNSWRVNNQGSDLGFFSVSGSGTATFNNDFVLNNNGGCNFPAIADISGGSLTHKTAGSLMATTANLGVLTVRGTGYLQDQTANFNLANAAAGTGIVNLLSGGTIEANKIQKTAGTATLNCDGGTLKAYTTNAGASFLAGLNNMFVYSGGLTFDSAGQSVTIGQAVTAPTGYGVGTSLGTIAVTSGGTGYVAPPLVTFAAPASGVAATGVAEINSSGTVTQIRITSPGSGYTSGQTVAVTFNGGDNTSNEAATVATPPTVTASTLNAAGGLTKIGAGTLTLNNTETYTGNTTVNVGTLALGASAVLPSGSNVSIASGATLDVSGLGASATYTLGSSATLLASGTGTTVGTNAATITGGATGTVSLGARPVSLTWGGAASGTDSTHPALTVSQGTLALGGNQFTVAGATTLGVGTYTLVTAPAITGSVNSTPLFSGGGGLGSGLQGVVSISGSSVVLSVFVPSTTITTSGSLGSVNTTYGTPSSETSFTVSGSTLTTGITIQPPAGYEVSTTSGSGYTGSGASITVGSPPTVSGLTIYVRLAATAPVTGTYNSQNIILSSAGTLPLNVVTAASGNNVSPKALTVASAVGNNKMFDGGTAATTTGTLQAAESFGAGTSSDGIPYIGDTVTVSGVGTFANSGPGTGISITAGTFTLGGASASNYSVTQPTGLSLSADIVTSAVWTQAAGSSWTTAGNWLNNVIGSGTNNTADFSTLSLGANTTVTLDAARTIGNLLFDDTNATKHTWTLNTGLGGTLTLAVTSGAPVISANVPTTIVPVIAGTQGLIKTGSSTLTLSGTDTYTGLTTVRQGTLDANNANALGTSATTLVLGDASTGANAVEFKVDTGVTAAVTLASLSNSNFGTGQTITINAGSALSDNAAALVTTLNLNGTSPVTIKGTNTGSHGTAQDVNWRITGSGIPTGTTALILDGTSQALRTSQLGNTSAASSFTGDVLIKGAVSTQNRTYLGGNNAGDQNLNFLNNNMTVSTGATWSIVWGGETVGALNGSGTIALNNQSALNNIGLTLGNTSVGGTYSGGISGGFGVAKVGTATQELSGSTIAYTGATTVNAGILKLTDTTGFNSAVAFGTSGTPRLLVNTTSNWTLPKAISGANATATFEKAGTGTLTLTQPNTFTGTTLVSGGTLLLSGGTLANSTVIDVQAAGTLSAGTLTIGSGQKLQGTGTVESAVTVASGGTLAPGGTGTIGTLTDDISFTLSGTSTFDINKSGATLTSDTVAGGAFITLGGNLTVTATGDTLALGDTFTLFTNTGGLSGNFTSFTLPSLPAGLSWDRTNLPFNGTITVVNNVSAPFFTPPAGGYQGAQSVTISSDAGSTIHYTTDGSDPTTSGTAITASSPLSGVVVPTDSNITILAYATKSGQGDSPVSSSTYQTVTTPTWNVDNNGSWSDASSWLNNVIPDGTGISADFNATPQSGDTTVSVDSNRTIGSLTFGNANAINWTLGTSGGSLTLATVSGSPTITVNNNTATLLVPLLGSQGLTKAGAGTLVLTGAKGYTGATSITGGILSTDTALPTGTLTLSNAGALQMTAAMTLANDVVVASGTSGTMKLNGAYNGNLTGNYSGVGGTLTLDASAGSGYSGFVINSASGPATGSVVNVIGTTNANNIQVGITTSANQNFFANTKVSVTATGTGNTYFAFGNGTTTNVQFGALDGGNATTLMGFDNRSGIITVNGTANGNFSGTIFNGFSAGALQFVKQGSGSQVLSGANTYTGTTSINGGVLRINGSLSASSAVTVASTATLSGTGNVAGPVTVQSGGFVTPGGSSIGTLSVGASTLNGTYTCQIDGATADSIAVNGNLTIGAGATIAFSQVNPATASSYTIATYTGTLSGTPTITGLPSGYTLDTSTAGQIKLVSATAYSTWAATFSGSGFTDTDPAHDPDHDGIPNIIEFLTNGNPTVGSETNLPTVSASGASLVFTFILRDDAAYLNPTVEFSTSLASGSWTTAVNGSNSTIGSVDNHNGTHTVTVTIPKGSQTKLFARLKVAIP